MKRRLSVRTSLLAAGCLAALSLACASYPHPGKTFEFFDPARRDDPFYPKITDWQERSARESGRVVDIAAVRPDGEITGSDEFGVLHEKFDRFLTGHKRSLAREFTAWSQRQARLHWQPDPETSLQGDHWPTVREFFTTNGDDCDGLDLIAYALLREAGFRADETYRMIVRREKDGANHMITLWFEERDDPWVIDATGAMSLEMVKFSEIPAGWLPRMMFNEDELYNVVKRQMGPLEVARGGDRPTQTEASR